MAKVTIISGFLGAGKTTFIKKLLEQVYAGQKVVLIENEFGEIGIDGGFLKDAGIQITEMNSGSHKGFQGVCSGQNHNRAIWRRQALRCCSCG